MWKNFTVILLSLSLLGVNSNSEAGKVSKLAKAYVGVKVAQKAAPLIAKKVIKNGVKDSTKPLLKNELKVGQYGKIIKNKENNLDYHHIPSTKQIQKYGVKKNDGIAMGVHHDRHTLTRTYKSGNKPILKNNEKPREALARDIKDQRKILQDNNLYNQEARNSLKEVIKQNKTQFPHLYN